MYAIIQTGGKQIKVEEGQTVYVEKLVTLKPAKQLLLTTYCLSAVKMLKLAALRLKVLR